MNLSPRAIALRGVGYGPLVLALEGFASVDVGRYGGRRKRRRLEQPREDQDLEARVRHYWEELEARRAREAAGAEADAVAQDAAAELIAQREIHRIADAAAREAALRAAIREAEEAEAEEIVALLAVVAMADED